MKAKNQYEDTRLNLRLANESYNISQQNGMDARKNAEMYDAMLYALEKNDMIKPLVLDKTDRTTKSFAIDKSGFIVAIDDEATISQYKIVPGGKTNLVNRKDDNPAKLPVESAVFATPDIVVYSLKDKSSYIADIKNNATRQQLPVKTDYIRSASVASDGTCAVAYNNGKVAIVPPSGKPSDNVKDFSKKLTDILCTAPGTAYVLCHDGSLVKWDYNNDKETKILAPESGQSAFKMAAIPGNRLAVCYNDGNIKFIDMGTGRVEKSKPVGHSKLENMIYDPKTGILALSSADKRITLYDTKNMDATPLAIEEHSLNEGRAKTLGFNSKGVLFALTDKDELRFWDTDITTYANTLQNMNLAPLTESERNVILGSELSEK